jgi:hypothetical protein
MKLVAAHQVQDLRHQLSAQTGFRVGAIDVGIDPFDFARTGAAIVDRAVAFSTPDGVRLAGLGTAWRARESGLLASGPLGAHGERGRTGSLMSLIS